MYNMLVLMSASGAMHTIGPMVYYRVSPRTSEKLTDDGIFFFTSSRRVSEDVALVLDRMQEYAPGLNDRVEFVGNVDCRTRDGI
jgi:hypothetical protein